MKTWMKYANRIIILIIILTSIYAFFERLSIGSYDRIPVVLSCIPVLLAPYLIKVIFKYDMSLSLRFFYFIFAFLGLTLGSVLSFYTKISWFDLFVHALSGVFTAFLALIFLKRIGLVNNKNLWFQILFMISFSLAIAGVWEIFEFVCDKITKGDAQKVLETGVSDTMEDMIIASVGAIVYSIIYIVLSKKNKKLKEKWLELL